MLPKMVLVPPKLEILTPSIVQSEELLCHYYSKTIKRGIHAKQVTLG